MKISCNVMEDILPLYVDECCSEDTKRLVEEHLSECENCKEKFQLLKQPLFLPPEHPIKEEVYVKQKKRAFKKLKRRWVLWTLIVILFLLPFTWLGVNEVTGDGISYSSFARVLKGRALLKELKKGNYEKAFKFLDLKELYESEINITIIDLDLDYTQIKIGDDIFYADKSTYLNTYQRYQENQDQKEFWTDIYRQKDNQYSPPIYVASYLNDWEMKEWNAFIKNKVVGENYVIPEEYDSNNIEITLSRVIPEEYYNRIKKEIKEEEKRVREYIQPLIDMGYEGYVEKYKERWISGFEQLKKQGVTIEGYKVAEVYRYPGFEHQLDYWLYLNINGEGNYSYGVSFRAKKDGFYPSGGIYTAVDDILPLSSTFRPRILD